jgi:hypothetical protein
MSITVIVKDDFGFVDSQAFNSLDSAGWYALPFAKTQSLVVIFRFCLSLGSSMG